MSTIKLPAVLAVDDSYNGSSIRQLLMPSYTVEASIANYKTDGVRGKLILPTDQTVPKILVVDIARPKDNSFPSILRGDLSTLDGGAADIDLSQSKWLQHAALSGLALHGSNRPAYLRRVIESWDHSFSFIAEDSAKGVVGLRAPQIGAVHTIHGHWSVSRDVATIVMPTGTGKTETMLSVLVSRQCSRVLVIVPTDALRTQIASKFLTLGILKDARCRVLHTDALYPVVGVLRQRLKDAAEVDEFFAACHVVVTTSHIAGQCHEAVQGRMAQLCPYLFIDEAHHAEAPTWLSFKTKFASSQTLQFTATPFREDGKPVDGKIIFRYPLRRAQEEGYFTPIRFTPVTEFNPKRADRAIAEKAVEQLRLDRPHNHILMARAGSVERAAQIFLLYERYKEFNPVQLHTGIKSKSVREEIRRKIVSGESKIVVCVDMLGEGFDLPELKIAAFHDIRKSLAVTLQLAGRFTRSRTDLGSATFIANIADVDVRDELRKLYTRDPDWNHLLPNLSEEIIGEQIAMKEFLEGFANFPPEIPLQSVRPATSTVVYKTRCDQWMPENFHDGIPGIKSFDRVHYDINHAMNALVIVTARKVPIVWADIDGIHNWDWALHVVIWDDKQNLLFINSSSNEGEFKALARAVAGDNAELINEQAVFRSFAGIHRLKLQNVGLTEQLGRLVRYTGRMGADVEPKLTEVQKRNTRKAVLSGTGFENGSKVTVGASRKGRIWSMRRTHLESLAAWCKRIGAKVLDESIDPDDVLKGTLESKAVGALPTQRTIGIDWPEIVYKEPETTFAFVVDEGDEWPLHWTDLLLSGPADAGVLTFALVSPQESIEIALTLFVEEGVEKCRFSVLNDRRLLVRFGASLTSAEEFFQEHPPVVWFADGASLEGNTFTPLKTKYAPYAREKIAAWDWSGVDLRHESQGVEKAPESIQFRVIEELKKKDYDVIVDDDGAGEAADIVTIKLSSSAAGGKYVAIEFYHCKYSKAAPGRRIEDMYEVCGQAQKSIRWMYSHEKQVELFTHLLRREHDRRAKYGASRIEVGDDDRLIAIREMSRACSITLRIFIVQPGISRAQATVDQLELLSVTENHLMETYDLPFGVIASA